MLPMPATTLWSSRQLFTARRLLSQAPRRYAASSAGSSGSGPRPAMPVYVSSSPGRKSHSRPKRRASTKRNSRPSSSKSAARVCAAVASPASQSSSRPVMRRWTASFPPSSNAATRNFPRRPSPANARPCRPSQNASAVGHAAQRASFKRTPSTRRPVSSPASAARTDSTSGSSGIALSPFASFVYDHYNARKTRAQGAMRRQGWINKPRR